MPCTKNRAQELGAELKLCAQQLWVFLLLFFPSKLGSVLHAQPSQLPPNCAVSHMSFLWRVFWEESLLPLNVGKSSGMTFPFQLEKVGLRVCCQELEPVLPLQLLLGCLSVPATTQAPGGRVLGRSSYVPNVGRLQVPWNPNTQKPVIWS